jgi:hypothetical protein
VIITVAQHEGDGDVSEAVDALVMERAGLRRMSQAVGHVTAREPGGHGNKSDTPYQYYSHTNIDTEMPLFVQTTMSRLTVLQRPPVADLVVLHLHPLDYQQPAPAWL